MPLDVPLLADERGSGLWAAYARPARMYGLVRTSGSTGLRDHALTGTGERLARATRSAIGFRSGRIGRVLETSDEVDLDELGLMLAQPPRAYLGVLGAVLRAGDRVWGGRLQGLWKLMKDSSTPDLRGFDPAGLHNDDQREALAAARDVAELLEVVEGAFRSDKDDELTPALADSPAFRHAALAGYDVEYEPVRRALELGRAQAMDALWEVHSERFPHAGAWKRNDDHVPWEKAMPDFGLDAPVMLYRQGVRM